MHVGKVTVTDYLGLAAGSLGAELGDLALCQARMSLAPTCIEGRVAEQWSVMNWTFFISISRLPARWHFWIFRPTTRSSQHALADQHSRQSHQKADCVFA